MMKPMRRTQWLWQHSLAGVQAKQRKNYENVLQLHMSTLGGHGTMT